jgi:hypothetical protein
MKERDRLSLKAYREEIEAKDRAERDEQERPIREAANTLKETSRKLAAVYRERLLGRVPDPDRIPVDRELSGISMSFADADKFNRAEFVKFRQAHSDVHWNDELIKNIGQYFEQNGLQIVTSSMIARVIERYGEAGLLPDPPQPEPDPAPVPEPVPVIASEPELIDGYDLESGEPRKWKPRELDRLSADQYRRALRLYKQNLALPNVGPGPMRRA